MKVQISKKQLEHYRRVLDFMEFEKLPDFIILEAEPLTATECCGKCLIPFKDYACTNAACDCHKPTERGECCASCVVKDGYIGTVGFTGVVGCYNTACPCHRKEGVNWNAPAFGKEEKCTCSDIQWPHQHTGKNFPFKDAVPSTAEAAPTLKEIEELDLDKTERPFGAVQGKLNELIRAINALRK